jgi:hypothetical protein
MSLRGPSKTIVVEPLKLPAKEPQQVPPAKEPQPAKA